MIRLELRPSSRVIQYIANIERNAGSWDWISRNSSLASDIQAEKEIELGVRAMFGLDGTHCPSLSESKDSPALLANYELCRRLIQAHQCSFNLNLKHLSELYALLAARGGNGSAGLDVVNWRSSKTDFLAPLGTGDSDSIVFPTVSAFLIPQRMEELFDWLAEELEIKTHHPLVLIGSFHLLFMQIHPFSSVNHPMGMLLLWHLLCSNNYSFVRYKHFMPFLGKRRRSYFMALRQAEKSALRDWSTFNVWLEFFLGVLAETGQTLLDESQAQLTTGHLTSVQKRIISVVKSTGPATREKIVQNTGLNLSTVKYNLGVLSEKGHLHREGGGRSTFYRTL